MTSAPGRMDPRQPVPAGDPKPVKCVVWDLDNTLWDGVLLEDRRVTVRPSVVAAVRTLDERGILHSIASRNDHTTAMGALREAGLADYFLHAQIHWQDKSTSIRAIAEALNIGLDAILFVDDQPFERDEVRFSLPAVRCCDTVDVPRLPDLPELTPRFVTDESRMRRAMVRADISRRAVEEGHHGSRDEFLRSLDMRFVIARAGPDDLERAEELTVRTNQLNATGYTYSYEELDHFRTSPSHDLFVASLDDRYGTYGTIGLALVERGADVWTLKLLLTSCRVMSRGVGAVLLTYILRRAARVGVRFLAEFVPTERNRIMYVTYRFAGFREIHADGGTVLLENDHSRLPGFPPHMTIVVEDS